MAQFEEKLNAILGNQEAMGQIMALARSLSGEQQEAPPCAEEPQPPNQKQPERNAGAFPDLSALFGQLDPGMVQVGMRVLQEFQAGEDRNTALLQALRPFLKEERQQKLDRAIQVANMTRLARTALDAMGGKGENRDV